MRYIQVLINMPIMPPVDLYIYHVPAPLISEIAFGKRVLVELAKRKVEGYIINENADPPEIDTKPVLSVLDREAILTPDLYELALWLAETYICPLSRAISSMIPRKLSHKSGQVIVPQINNNDLIKYLEIENSVTNSQLIKALIKRSSINYHEVVTHTKANELKDLETKGIIYIAGTYKGFREKRDDCVYVCSENLDNYKLIQLKRKAPRQAEIIQMLYEKGAILCKELEEKASRYSIKSLLKKEYIKIKQIHKNVEAYEPNLNQEQEKVLRAVNDAIVTAQGKEILLYGVTGSGKTEVYIRAALSCIERGKKVIMLIPEIALTRHLLDTVTGRIPKMAVIHSSMSAGERYEEWKRIKQGETDLVIGTRSAIFAPLSNIGLIIIDEEQEYSYKQEQQPRYHAREVARERARRNNAVLLLGSATPSIETYYCSEIGKSIRLDMSYRAGDALLPEINIVDMKKVGLKARSQIISPLLEDKIMNALDRSEQCILFLNRRGFTPYTICRNCGNILTCPNCSVGLNYHKDQGIYLCHYCGNNYSNLAICPSCGSSYLQQTGYGTQRVEEDVRLMFPQARIARLDLDSSTLKGIQDKILQGMKDGNIDILIGTQMVAKGLDFPGVSLVGILDADGMLTLPDFRSGERCFQLIVQAAGRAGRSSISGEVIIQTYNPDNQLLSYAAQQDYAAFYREEIKWRQMLNYPPFSHILRLVIISPEDKIAHRVANNIQQFTIEITDAKEDNLVILGPAPCPLYRVRNKIRYQLIIKSENMLLLNSVGANIASIKWHKQAKVEIDLNPLSSM
ncbi:MAG: replication restart helicase PriA [Syntrophomonadaceae bacterium]|jgi:primosomal protein N' (replication factor Y)